MDKRLRILFVSSSRSSWYAKGTSAAAHFAAAPYSIDAIGYNLERQGWTVAWLGWRNTANPFRLAKEIDAFRPDVVYTYGSTAAVWPIFLKRVLCRHRAFVVVHGWDDPYERIWNELFGWPGKLLMLAVQKFLVTHSDAVVTLSYALQKRGRAWGVDCAYIPNGADPIDSRAVKGTIRLEGRFKLVYTGDKAKWKQTVDICRAMRHLPRDIKLYLTGRDEAYLKPYLSENCISLGWLSKADQLAVMSQADAFVCTSNQDCNAKLQEYLRWEKPILALHGEPDNFFKDGENALLAWDGDYAPLVQRLADDPALCRRLAENAAREIPVYSWAEIAAQFDAYFRGLISVCGRVGDLVSYSHADKIRTAVLKLLFIDHEMHRTTQSTRFLVDLLRTDFAVTEFFYAQIYRTGAAAAMCGQDIAVILEFPIARGRFFFPGKANVFVPMYDNEWGSVWQWRRLAASGMGVVSFCEKVSAHARRCGVRNLLDVRYFPDPATLPQEAGDPKKVFLWERGGVSREQAEVFFPASDGYELVVKGANEFLPRADYLARLASCGIVLAPRRKEGIGMAFLEALAMGKCVVAHNDATMNEYIVDGTSGLLVDFDHPVRISPAQVSKVRAGVATAAAQHWARWMRDKAQIVPFLAGQMPCRPSFGARLKIALEYPLYLAEGAWWRLRHG